MKIESEISEFKRRAREAWAAGDYPKVAKKITEVGRGIVARMAIQPGEAVLDVACGAGNASIPAATAGGRVTGIDLTPELFDAARAQAAQAGVNVEWREGDAEALPVDDESFDVVMSVFGCMFAPRHDVTARELARVMRRGGRLGLCNWTPEGAVGGFFGVIGKHLPPPPPFAMPPPLWGDEEHVRTLFAGTGMELEFERTEVHMPFDSVPEMLAFYTSSFGPIVKARKLLQPQGRWPALRDDLQSYFEASIIARDGSVVWPAEYLMVLGRKA